MHSFSSVEDTSCFCFHCQSWNILLDIANNLKFTVITHPILWKEKKCSSWEEERQCHSNKTHKQNKLKATLIKSINIVFFLHLLVLGTWDMYISWLYHCVTNYMEILDLHPSANVHNFTELEHLFKKISLWVEDTKTSLGLKDLHHLLVNCPSSQEVTSTESRSITSRFPVSEDLKILALKSRERSRRHWNR